MRKTPFLTIFGKTAKTGIFLLAIWSKVLSKRLAFEEALLGFYGFWGFGQKWSFLTFFDIFGDLQFCQNTKKGVFFKKLEINFKK
jgi:hypothetical protein